MTNWNEMAGHKPEVITDDVNFEPISGAYVCRIDSIGRKQGTSQKGNEYDFHSLNVQVIDTISGDKGNGRYLSKSYNTQNLTEWTKPEDEKKRLINDMFTAGIEYNLNSDEAFEDSLILAKDKTINIRAWVKSKDSKKYQNIKVVKEFKIKNEKKETSSEF